MSPSLCFTLLALAFAHVAVAQYLPAPNSNSILLYSSSTIAYYGSPVTSSLEYTNAVSLGLTVVPVTQTQWVLLTASDIKSYRAVVFGDPTCVVGEGPIASAVANVAFWGPLITGNVVIQGTDPAFHATYGGRPDAANTIKAFIRYAASSPIGATGLFLCLSCYYNAYSGAIPWLNSLALPGSTGSWVASPPGCGDDVMIVATSPALTGVTDANMEGWECSIHESFSSYTSDFDILVIDASSGSFPYILARGNVVEIGGPCNGAGFYQATNGSCLPCPAGLYSLGGSVVTSCSCILANTYSSGGVCLPCPAGETSPFGVVSTSCTCSGSSCGPCPGCPISHATPDCVAVKSYSSGSCTSIAFDDTGSGVCPSS